MEKLGVWLGPLRGPVRLLAIGFTALSLLILVWMILGHFVSDAPYTMNDMIRPGDRILPVIMLISIFGSLLFGSLYFSDNKGRIESDHDGFFDVLSLVTARMAMFGVALILVTMFYEVVARYVFNAPTLWANELSLWIASVVFLFAGQYAMQQRSHIRIYVIYDLMPRWMQKASDIVSVFLICSFTFALIWGGYADAKRRLLRMETFGTAWDPPLPGTVKTIILAIILLVAIQAVSNLIADWNKMPEHHGVADDVDEAEIEDIRRTLED